jgi:hypothetical protein
MLIIKPKIDIAGRTIKNSTNVSKMEKLLSDRVSYLAVIIFRIFHRILTIGIVFVKLPALSRAKYVPAASGIA